MEKGQRIYIINPEHIPEEWNKTPEELTDMEFIGISNGWDFDTIEDFVEHFNEDAPDSPMPSYHYIRII